jgi:EAL domain-containing protein (putative c-di-GMP-specific phosphodiesterase class I)
MAVNLSARQFSDGQLIDNLKRKLAFYGVSPSCLSLEVTEGILILDLEQALTTLKQVREFGVGLDLDDFGTGYSSLSYLQQFPFNSLKIDRSFVKNMEEKQEKAALIRSIIALAHSLGLSVVAEGVETKQQLEMLREIGCEIGQGYLFSRPLPGKELEDYLRFEHTHAFTERSDSARSGLGSIH